ncbi:hypothetical protein [Leucobacter sp. gxy201]|uniref:hypothetical protein n=1 Tax=Leucobacter sp. gxy201 TaxID=2957200 RepID=UPI003DA06B53
MSEDRDTPAPTRAAEAPETAGNPGAPVEEVEASRTEVLEAVERAKGAGDTANPAAADAGEAGDAGDAGDAAGSAAEAKPAEAADGAQHADAEQRHREEVSQVDTQLDLEMPGKTDRPRIAETDEMPSAAASPLAKKLEETPVRDGEIRISADHPMAALYTQTPAPPEIKGNRGAGVLISVLAAIGFAVVYAGATALLLATSYPPSTFLEQGLLPAVLSIGFGAAVAGFLLGMIVLVLIAGRAGWWVYAIGGFFVGVAVWAATAVGTALHDRFVLGQNVSLDVFDLVQDYGLTIPVLVAAVVAREACVWFGAWIGARGRRMKARNAEALAEYEQALAEVQAQPR